MSQHTIGMTLPRPQLNAFDKTVALGCWVGAGALFFTLGWIVLAPDDPLGPVSLLTRDGAFVTLITTAMLCAIVAALTTAVVGRRLPDVGTFAAALGLAVASLRGESAGYLAVQMEGTTGGFDRWLVLKLAMESLAWLGVMGTSVLTSAFVMRRLHPPMEGTPNEEHSIVPDLRKLAVGATAGFDIPKLGPRLYGIAPDEQTSIREGLIHALVVAGITLLFVGLTSTGFASRIVTHGQACFIVAGGVTLSSYIAYQISPVRSAGWPIMGVALFTIVSFLWADVSMRTSSLPNLPPSPFLRILPIQYVSVGTATAIAMVWYFYMPVSRWSVTKVAPEHTRTRRRQR